MRVFISRNIADANSRENKTSLNGEILQPFTGVVDKSQSLILTSLICLLALFGIFF